MELSQYVLIKYIFEASQTFDELKDMRLIYADIYHNNYYIILFYL